MFFKLWMDRHANGTSGLAGDKPNQPLVQLNVSPAQIASILEPRPGVVPSRITPFQSRRAKTLDVGALPVCDGERLVGMIKTTYLNQTVGWEFQIANSKPLIGTDRERHQVRNPLA